MLSQLSDEAVVCAGGRWGVGWKVFNWQADFFFLCLPWLVIENEGGGFFLCLPFPPPAPPFPFSPPPPLPLSLHPSWLAGGRAAPRSSGSRPGRGGLGEDAVPARAVSVPRLPGVCVLCSGLCPGCASRCQPPSGSQHSGRSDPRRSPLEGGDSRFQF